ncbi:MAG TPA: sigma factor-like helix-turn-helix DNA-binding protein, partial [Gemmataceae bacterium]|nr:sigma factor-like helix-turn-helix DNA-binding protein [Gemmataceae bacterium]
MLDAELNALPEKYRLPLVLCYLEGRTHEEATRQLGWPAGTVGSRLARGRDRLRSRLAQRGLSLAAGPFAVVLAANTSSAALPAALARATLEAALRIAAGKAVAGTVSAHVVALVDAASQSLSVIKLKTIALLLVGLCVLGAGAGVVAQRVSTSKHPEAQQGEEPEAVAKRPEAAKKEKSAPDDPKKPRTDRYGDPLPDGVLARMGSGRMRHGCYRLGFSPDGKLLVSGGGSGGIRVWDVATGKLKQRFQIPSSYVDFAYGADGVTLTVVSAEKGCDCRLLDPANGKELQRIKLNDAAAARAVAVAPAGKLIAVGREKAIHLHDPATGKETLRIGVPALRLSFAPDAKTIAVTDVRDTVRIYDTATAKTVANLKRDGARMMFASFSPDGRSLASISYEEKDDAVSIWDLATGQERHRLKGTRDTEGCAAFSPDSKLLATGGQGRDMVLWDVATGKELRRFGAWYGAAAVAFTPDGKTLAAGSGAITLWDVATGRLLPASANPIVEIWHLQFTQGGKRLLGGSFIDFAWDAKTGEEIRQFPAVERFPIWDAPLSPDEALLASADQSGTIRLWDATTGKEVRALKGHKDLVWTMRFTPDSRRLISSSTDQTIRVWEVASGREIYELTGRGVAN